MGTATDHDRTIGDSRRMQQQGSSPLRFLSGMQMTIPSAHLVLIGFHWRIAEIGNQLDRLFECWLTDPDEMRLQNPFQTLRHFNFKDQG